MKNTIIIKLMLAVLLASCANSSRKDNTHYIRVGITSGPEKEIAEAARLEAKNKYNLEVELVTFSEYVMPNEALNQGDIDVNVFQHVPYLNEQSRQRGYQLAVVGKTFVYPIVAYSKKIKNVSELEDKSTIAIPNDAANAGRSLLLLEKNGLIQLRADVGLLPKLTDIVGNPEQLKIIEIDAPQLPRVLGDAAVTVAIINNNFAAQAGLNFQDYGLLRENAGLPYVNVIVARQDNKDQENVRYFIKAYQSEAVVKKANEVFKGGAIKGW